MSRSKMACATRTCVNWVAGVERNCRGNWLRADDYGPGLVFQNCGFTDLYAKASLAGNKAVTK